MLYYNEKTLSRPFSNMTSPPLRPHHFESNIAHFNLLCLVVKTGSLSTLCRWCRWSYKRTFTVCL